MTERMGLIRENLPDGSAIVLTDRHGACTGCHSGGAGCRSCLSSAKIESRVANPVDARAGDVVLITLKRPELFKAAALFYLVPIVCLTAAALAGAGIGIWAGWGESAGSILGGLIGLSAGIGLAMLIGRSDYGKRRLAPAITSVVKSAGRRPEEKLPACCR